MNTKLIIGALAIAGALLLPATSALAAGGQPGFSFGFSVGDGNGNGGGINGGMHPHHDDNHPHHDDRCMSPRDILSDLADQGYSRFRPVDKDRHSFTIDARRHFRWFELTVDNCDGEILNVDRIDHP